MSSGFAPWLIKLVSNSVSHCAVWSTRGLEDPLVLEDEHAEAECIPPEGARRPQLRDRLQLRAVETRRHKRYVPCRPKNLVPVGLIA